MADKLTLMEHFNGRTYQPVPEGSDPVTVTLWHNPQDMLNLSYEALRTSVYQSLALQTRLKPYLDEIGLNITDAGIQIDFIQVKKDFTVKIDASSALNKSRCWRYGEQASSSVRQHSNSIWKEAA